jgi:hypothetical protein
MAADCVVERTDRVLIVIGVRSLVVGWLSGVGLLGGVG